MLSFDFKLLRQIVCLASAASLASACGSSTTTSTDDVTAGTSDATGDTGADIAGDVSSTADAAANTLIANGEYYLAVNVVPFGGLILPFKATLTASGSLTAGGMLNTLELRAVSDKETPIYVSDPIGTVANVPVAKGGAFTATFSDPILIPGKASPTGSDVHVANFVLSGTISADGTLCGDMSGTVVEFAKDVATSTFKAVPWGKQAATPESACTAAVVKHYPGIATCPTLTTGVNTFTSAERSRRFTIYLPQSATATDLPVVFLYHGVGGDMSGIVSDTGFDKLQATEQFILVVPESERDANGIAVTQTEWDYSAPAFTDDNPDLVFFDDMLKCVSGQYKTSAKRVYITGMSGGGLMTVFTSFNRAST